MHYSTFVGLDVHKSSISACSINIETAEKRCARFGYDVEALVKWLTTLDGPVLTVYESGFCGFHLKRELEARGIPCKIAAISKLAKPSGDRVKTDRRDAEFLARQLAAGNISGVFVPSLEMEGMRDIARSYEALRDELQRHTQRLDKMCLRYGIRYTKTKTHQTKSYEEWLKYVQLPSPGAQRAFDIDLATFVRLSEEKASLVREIEGYCDTDAFKDTVDALCCLVGIRKVTAFRLICEIGDFSRFSNARGFAAYLGLVPSESSSGVTTSKGRITKCGNNHVRKLLVEIAWCYNRTKNAFKKADPSCSEAIVQHAQKGNRRLIRKRSGFRGKNACVANTATARELSLWIWSIANMVEQKASYGDTLSVLVISCKGRMKKDTYSFIVES
jgi:transposase